MEAKDVLTEGYKEVLLTLEEALAGLSGEDLDWQPRPDCNSIGWLAWHVARGEDVTISLLTREEQIWIKDGWHQKFNRPADRRDYGTGNTIEQVASFRSPSAEIILGYLRAVTQWSETYLAKVTAEDLDQVAKLKYMDPPPTAGVFLSMMLSECTRHAGQAAYVRGMRQGKGWYTH